MSRPIWKNVYYTIKNIVSSGSEATVDLFSDVSLKKKVGRALFSKNGYADASGGQSQELTTFFLEDKGKSNLSFLANINAYDAVVTAGKYNYLIICGQGRYLGINGVVSIEAFDNGMRNVAIKYRIE
jgi:hypothetical protein